MSEQKDTNEINFDDEFLEIDFGNESSINTTKDSNIDLDLTLDATKLDDIEDSTNNNIVQLPQPESVSDEDFFHQLDNLSQAEKSTSSTDNNTTEEALAIGTAGASTIGAVAANNKSTPEKKKSLNELFSKKNKSPTIGTSKPKGKTDITGVLSDSKKLNKLILGGVIALTLIGMALYMAMSDGDSQSVPPPAEKITTPTSAPQTAPSQASTKQGDDAQLANAENIDNADAPTQSGNDILPDIKPLVNPDEILNAGIPDDPTLIKEEIDRLSDTNSQITEQEKLIQEQLAMMEELTAAKEEAIALLEAQIAQELEKQKTETAAK